MSTPPTINPELSEHRPPRRNWWKITALFVLLVVMGYFLRNYFREANEWKNISVVDTETEALVLGDGSKIWVQGNSTLSRPGKFPVKERRVRLQGEAYFEVVADVNRPFIVETASVEVKALGTSFEVRELSEEATVRVKVKTGRVQMQIKNSTQKIYLEDNESGIFNKNEKTLKKEKITF